MVAQICRVTARLVSLRADDHRSDDPGSDCGKNIIAVYLAPLIAVWRLLQMIVAIVYALTAVPVFLVHSVAMFPFFVVHLGVIVVVVLVMIVVMILGERDSSGKQDRNQRGVNNSFVKAVHQTSRYTI